MLLLRNLTATISGAAFAASTGVVAQIAPVTPTGSHLAREPEAVELQTVRRMQKVLGDCIYANEAEAADHFLASSDPVNVDYARLGYGVPEMAEELDLDRCLGRAMRIGQQRVEMRTNPGIVRSLLAEEAYLERHDEFPSAASLASGLVARRYFVSGQGEALARARATLADCIVVNAPAQADALIRSAPGTERERAAALALDDALSACMANWQPSTVTVGDLRAVVADGLWVAAIHAASPNAERAVN